jgi:hypothetical protein
MTKLIAMMAECLNRGPEVPEYHLAQLNIAKMKFAIDAPELDEFVARLEDVNTLADDSPGFVWRLQSLRQNGPTAGAFTFKQIFSPE